MLYQGNDIYSIFIGFAMLGLAIGLMEAAIVTYLVSCVKFEKKN